MAWYENNFLNYSVIFEKAIKPQQTVVVRVCYISDKIVVSNMGSAPITIWMIDEKRNWWSQPLFAPDNKIYNSTKASHKEWKDYLGARIKEHNKQRLIKICKDKEIPCYQMLPQYFTSTYESEPYQLL